MRQRQRILVVALATVLLTAAAVLLVSGGSGAAPSKSQALFRKTLLEDAKTTSAIKGLLRERGGFVAPEILFTDLTGDARSDAVVLVETGGVAGAVALYVFSTHGKSANSDLRAVYRSQRLYRGTAQVSDARLIVRVPKFARGDDVCCPDKLIERVYSWSDAAKTLVKRSVREIDGPS
ncbi:MAG: hypothetical protein ACRDLS_13445 [Solirubrobacteraceae bacterium]